MHRSVRRWPIFVCLGLILVYPLFAMRVQGATGELASSLGEFAARIATEGAIWLYGGAVLAIALVGERRSLASIGLGRPKRWTPLLGLFAAIGLIALGAAASFVTYNLLHEHNNSPKQVEALVRGSLVYAMFIAVRGGVIEEILYRGLAIEQLTTLTGRRWLAAIAATLIFVVNHALRFDLLQLIPIATAAAALTGLYLWRRNLWINIIAHTLVDALALGVVALHATKLY